MKFKNIISLFLIGMVGVLAGCRDDLLYDPEGDGPSMITATVDFSPVLTDLGGTPTRTDGNVLNHVRSFCMLIYNADGQLVRKVKQEELDGYSISDNTVMPPDRTDAEQAEEKTPKATFTFDGLPVGKYKIYGVANMGDLSQYEESRYETEEALRSIQLVWNEDDIASNDQMLGYFTPADAQSSTGFDAPLITVGHGNVQLHAWIKRAASKVTVAIDGSGLYKNVSVYIKSVQIKDIPRYCWLGEDNVATAHNLIEDGERQVVNEEAGANGPVVTNTKTWPADISKAHTQTANAFFFYENMQGEGESKTQADPNDPTKVKHPNGNSPLDPGFKDGKRAGSYIEVVGYYKSTNRGEDGEGKEEGSIIYRFMLGKNITTNYDAERNHHYKLTLKLKKWGNDADWHIVYNQDPDIISYDPYYISYVYDEQMGYPIKIVGGKLIKLWAEIPVDDVNKNSWHADLDDGEINPTDPNTGIYWSGKVNNPGPWNGFLSLCMTDNPVIGSVAEGYSSSNAATYTFNYNYFYGNAINPTPSYYRHWNLSRREYQVDIPEGQTQQRYEEEEGSYRISRVGEEEYMAYIPFYSRARVMVAQTGYTGNNPYVGYTRSAHVTIHATVRKANGEEVSLAKTILIKQMRRLINPKGIWRSATCTAPFHVQLKVLPSDTKTQFQNLVSDGPWLAVPEGDSSDWFELLPTPGLSQRNPDGTISGTGNGDPFDPENPGAVIDFTFRPKGTTKEPRAGMIKIYYNNYTCIHHIFVRQGYDPVSFYGSNTYWHSANLKTINKEVEDPVLEGSYFRRYNRKYPIAASNNTVDWFDKNGMSRDFAIAGSKTPRKWEEITTTRSDWGDLVINGTTCRLPTKKDMEDIMNNKRTMYGYGILYTDESTEVSEDASIVYGYSHKATKGSGMRGVFVGDSVTGTNIFFPIGASGYGRFKQFTEKEIYNRQRAGYGGVIQYANRYQPMPNVANQQGVGSYPVRYKPLFWNLWRREGALYWLGNVSDGKNYSNDGLDINFYTLDFAPATVADLGLVWSGTKPDSWGGPRDPSGTDAIQMRLVEDRGATKGKPKKIVKKIIRKKIIRRK
ncbi:MAG: hypothetical protein NC328_00520 [Muribaculum sp.]|nr:hypothetical protein [Muribaculum sp.]